MMKDCIAFPFFLLRPMYAFYLCISRLIALGCSIFDACSLTPDLSLLFLPLHAPTRPVDLEFLGHAHFFGAMVVYRCREPVW
jgi:hypothetical protein